MSLRILVGMPEGGSQGGPAACEPPFIEELRRLGHEVDELVYAYADSGASVARRIARVRSTAKRFRDRMLIKDYDVVHINTAFDKRAVLRDSFVLSCLPLRRGKVFLKFHGSDPALLKSSNPLLRRLVRYVLSRADGIGILSSEEQRSFLNFGADPEKTFLVKNAVTVAANVQTSTDSLKSSETVPLLLFIARFIPTKGLLDVIRAGGLLRERGYEFVLLCVGDGPERGRAEEESKRLGLTSHVRFVGYVSEEEAAEFYSQSTMLLFPTFHNEGFPMVIFNALAHGLPVVTTRIRAAADYLSEPANCLWVREKDPEMLADKIESLLSDRDLRARMQSNNRVLAQQFTAQVVTPEYLDVFERLLRK